MGIFLGVARDKGDHTRENRKKKNLGRDENAQKVITLSCPFLDFASFLNLALVLSELSGIELHASGGSSGGEGKEKRVGRIWT